MAKTKARKRIKPYDDSYTAAQYDRSGCIGVEVVHVKRIAGGKLDAILLSIDGPGDVLIDEGEAEVVIEMLENAVANIRARSK